MSLSKSISHMEMGTPVLDDPKETISPPGSEPVTPLTASTALTVPSPIPHLDNKQSDKESDVPRCLSISDAAGIPLPPSPPLPKASLPFRRPRISNPLSRVVSDRQPGSRSASGRRVSSALQYALHPEPEKDVTERVMSDTTSASIDLEYYQQMKDEVSWEGSDLESNDGAGQSRPNWDSTLGFGGQVLDLTGDSDTSGEGEGGGTVGQRLTGQEEDEAWMGYVRQQLNTLFPDFFEADALLPSGQIHQDEEAGIEHGLNDEEGNMSVSTVATSDLPTPPRGPPRISMGLGMNGVPNVRTEIGGLRDEIARLRGVVSELAEDMRGSHGPATEPSEVTPGLLDPADMDEEEIGKVLLPEGFIKTAHLSVEIIRLLQARLGRAEVPDTEVFSESNLVEMKDQLGSLNLGNKI